MNDHLARLIQLQTLDLQRARHREDQEDIPRKYHASEQRFIQAQEAFLKLKADHEAIVKERKGKEQDLKIAEEKITKLKLHLSDLKTNKEYQAYMSEIEAAKSVQGKIEEQLLLLMDKAEQIQKDVAAQEAVVVVETQAFQIEKTQGDARAGQLAEALDTLAREWTIYAEGMDAKMLEVYCRLLTGGKGVAVVPLDGQTCGGCHFMLPPQQVAEVKTGGKTLRCSYCHRFLYAKSDVPPPT